MQYFHAKDYILALSSKPSEDKTLYRINKKTGNTVWGLQLEDGFYKDTTVVFDGNDIILQSKNWLYSISESGRVNWKWKENNIRELRKAS